MGFFLLSLNFLITVSLTPIFYFCKSRYLCIWYFSTIQSVKNNESQSCPISLDDVARTSGVATVAATKLREHQRKSYQRNRNTLQFKRLKIIIVLYKTSIKILHEDLNSFFRSPNGFSCMFFLNHSSRIILHHTSSQKCQFLCNNRLKNNLFCC